ncbi:MAG: flagellar biosynthetic protein FliR [Steroidobacteraceae bacterium]
MLGWLGAVMYPFLRIGGCLMVAPVFGASHVPRRVRVLLAMALTVAVQPVLPPVPALDLQSVDGIFTGVQQILIGIALGFVLQIAFDALALAGQLLANGMGLGFAFNMDPLRGAQSPVLGQLYVIVGTLTFLALDGHIALLRLLVGSFQTLPIGPTGIGTRQLFGIATWGSTLFSGALHIALPGMTSLLVINLAFGVTSRAAPALNLFALGLPVTLMFGLIIVLLGLPAMQTGFTQLLAETFTNLQSLVAPR